MSDLSNDRLVKNEQLIRDKNADAEKAIRKYFHDAKELKNNTVAFICECSELDCNRLVNLTIDKYVKLHKRKDRFTIHKGHAIPDIEKVVDREGDVIVVEKFKLAAS